MLIFTKVEYEHNKSLGDNGYLKLFQFWIQITIIQ